MAIEVIRRQEGHAEVQCPFCQGTGIDPLEVMSPLSHCPVCMGKKTLTLREPLQECAFCGGSGLHPHTRMTCTACLGKGAVTMVKPVETCSHCGGTGANGHDHMPCTVCKGIGVVPAEKRLRATEEEKVGSGT